MQRNDSQCVKTTSSRPFRTDESLNVKDQTPIFNFAISIVLGEDGKLPLSTRAERIWSFSLLMAIQEIGSFLNTDTERVNKILVGCVH